MPPKSRYPDETWLDDQYSNYPPSFGRQTRRPRTWEERQNFTIFEDPDCREDTETPATPWADPSTDPTQGNPNAQSDTDAETNPGPQANMEPTIDTNVPETPSMFAAIGIGQMMLASTRQPVALAAENFIGGDDDDAPPSPSPAEGRVSLTTRLREEGGSPVDITTETVPPINTDADGGFVVEPESEPTPANRPRMDAGERFMRGRVQRSSNAMDDNENSGFATVAAYNVSEAQFRAEPSENVPLTAESNQNVGVVFDYTSMDNIEPPFRSHTSDPNRGSFGNNSNELAAREISGGVGIIAGEDPSENFPQTPIRTTKVVPFALPQAPASQMLPPQRPASLMKPPQSHESPKSHASQLLTPRKSVPALIVRSPEIHGKGPGGTPLARLLFHDPSSPAPKHTAWEPQRVRPPIPNVPPHPSPLKSMSLFSTRNEDTEMASPRATTPENQIGGSPPTPSTPRTPRIWISPSLLTPELAARMITPRAYRNRDEPMEITPSPTAPHESPTDEDMDDVFWTSRKPTVSSNVDSSVKADTTAPKPGPMENMTPVESAAPIEKATSAEDAAGPSTTTVKTVVKSREIEITTTYMTTPSPPETPVASCRTAANLRLGGATPRKAGHTSCREAASAPQYKGKSGVQQKTNRRRTADQIVAGGINRRQELRTSPRYSLRESTKGVVAGTYSFTPVRNKTCGAKTCPAKK